MEIPDDRIETICREVCNYYHKGTAYTAFGVRFLGELFDIAEADINRQIHRIINNPDIPREDQGKMLVKALTT